MALMRDLAPFPIYSDQERRAMATPKYRHDNAVVLGRFQIFHNEHEALIRGALSIAKNVLLVIGSADSAVSLNNPFTLAQRKEMIHTAFSKEIASGRLVLAGLNDYIYRTEKWNAEFTKLCDGHFWDKGDYIFYTYAKDAATTQYIDDGLPRYVRRVYHTSTNKNVNATDIRKLYFSHYPCGNLPHISQAVGFLLHSYKLKPEYEQLCKEQDAIEAYKKSWASAPFPPHFVAVDALVTWHDAWKKPYFLVGVRASEFGNGKWCIPGGFLEVEDTLLESAKRELLEETSLVVDDSFILDNVSVFDDPNRSMRGRMLTHVHEWRVCSKTKPVIKAGSDLSDCFWLPFDEVHANKSKFFSDHYPIIAKLHPDIEEY